MKLSRKLKLRIIIGIAAAMILYGVLDKFFKFNVNQKVVDNVAMVLMILAFGLLFSRGDQSGKNEKAGTGENAAPDEIQDQSQIEQTALENDMVKDQDKGAANNDDSRNDLRS
ncbi:hypothetical protein [Ruminiclostridium cellobioparum]|uniref:Uncharacterized protein n=1 Tax=Ruminiclostridium cellobioparum subsp. termitidis CT1112 TaxID=1195236 RepID=S0FKT8_RUMCE|nr:hypothetical protein [Ruminiclostridium cellobioparum]EMS69138.1 hypothetical protein CTER_5252 [Ruminiclostridium cellobioparum subsp. termitidis CT1112]